MTTTLLGLLFSTLVGNATYYGEGVFEDVWRYRSTYLPACAECVGFAAMIEPRYIGQKIWVSYGRKTVGPLYVIDCAAKQHIAKRLARGDVLELPYWLARQWGMIRRGRIHVTVHFSPPATPTTTPAGARM